MIGLLGATGSVGHRALRFLRQRTDGTMRVGCRSRNAAEALVAQWDLKNIEVFTVDATNGSSLMDFAEPCSVLVNCMGPSSRFSKEVAEVALAMRVPVVDAGGLYSALPSIHSPAQKAERTVLWYAGAVPGISGLLARFAAQCIPGCEEICVYHAIRDVYTPAGALDFLHDLRSYAAAGEGSTPTSTRKPDKELDEIAATLLDAKTHCHAFRDFEGDRLRRQLHLRAFSAYSIVAQGHVSRALQEVHALEDTKAATFLCRASHADLFGRETRVCLAVEAARRYGDAREYRSVVLEAGSISSLTAACVTVSVLAILEGHLAHGAMPASEALDASRVFDVLQSVDGTLHLHLSEEPLRKMILREAGVL